jgi:hypothetical protein
MELVASWVSAGLAQEIEVCPFLYNAIFFRHTLVLTSFYDVPKENAPVYLIAFAVGISSARSPSGICSTSWGGAR